VPVAVACSAIGLDAEALADAVRRHMLRPVGRRVVFGRAYDVTARSIAPAPVRRSTAAQAVARG
jgi:hypothetical protein